jgi:hypothetical protein
MKRLLSITAIALITSSFFAPTAHAQMAWGNINMTQSQLQARINMGVRTGSLTRREASDLQSKLARFSALENSLRRNGLSFSERNRLNIALSNISADIQRQLTDSDRRWNNRYGHGRPNWHR